MRAPLNICYCMILDVVEYLIVVSYTVLMPGKYSVFLLKEHRINDKREREKQRGLSVTTSALLQPLFLSGFIFTSHCKSEEHTEHRKSYRPKETVEKLSFFFFFCWWKFTEIILFFPVLSWKKYLRPLKNMRNTLFLEVLWFLRWIAEK